MANDWSYYANIANDEETRRNNDLNDRANEAQDRLRVGTQRINDEWDGAFTPDFYNNYAKQLTDYWRPDIDRQYGDATRQLNYGFANTQPGGGSVSAEGFGRLKEAYDRALLTSQDNGKSAADQLRQNNEGQRGALLNQLAQGADPSMVVQQGIGQLNAIPRTPNPSTYSPVGDIFGNLTSQFAVAQDAYNSGAPGWGFSIRPTGNSPLGRSSTTIVN